MIQWLKDNIDNIRFFSYSDDCDGRAVEYLDAYNDFLIMLKALDDLKIFEWEIKYLEEYVYVDNNRVLIYRLVSLILYKDNVIITDYAGGKHQIRETFSKFDLKVYLHQGVQLINVRFMRTLLSDVEASSYYLHSHCSCDGLNSSTIPKFHHFCIGSSSFQKLLSRFNDRFSLGISNKSIKKIEDSLEYIPLYKQLWIEWLSSLSCESATGGPYKRIVNIAYTLAPNNQTQVATHLHKFINTLLILIRDKKIDIDFEFIFVGDKMILCNLEKIKELLESNKQLFTDEELYLYFSIYQNGNEYVPRIPTAIIPELAKEPYVFKGREFKQRIYSSDFLSYRDLLLHSTIRLSNKLIMKFKVELENRINLINILNNGR